MDLNVTSKGARLERRGLRTYLTVSKIVKYLVFLRLEEKEESVYV